MGWEEGGGQEVSERERAGRAGGDELFSPLRRVFLSLRTMDFSNNRVAFFSPSFLTFSTRLET